NVERVAAPRITRVPHLPPGKAGRGSHVYNEGSVLGTGGSTGDFEGCARPSQPTIGIAALEARQRGAQGHASRTNPRGEPRRAAMKKGSDPISAEALGNGV